jgi:hypothetical protein
MSTMSSKLKVVALAVMLGTATVAAAQSTSRAQAFASQFQQYQALSGTGTYNFRAGPKFGTAQDPVGNESFSQRFADMQAASSNSGEWRETRPTLTAIAADPEGKEPFAQRYSEMQAASSNSGQWAFHPGANVPADEANSTLVAGKPVSKFAPSNVAASK